jgi:hypothetical protein
MNCKRTTQYKPHSKCASRRGEEVEVVYQDGWPGALAFRVREVEVWRDERHKPHPRSDAAEWEVEVAWSVADAGLQLWRSGGGSCGTMTVINDTAQTAFKCK